MKWLKRIGLVLLALIAIVLVLAAFTKKTVSITRSIDIQAPKEAVFDMVNELTTWERWSPWQLRDSTIKLTYSSPSAGKNAYYSWTSENSGDGKLTITDVFGTDSLKTAMDFGSDGTALAGFTFSANADEGTKVDWSFSSDFPYPFNAMLLFMDFEGMISKDYEEGLANLKKYAEAQPRKATAPSYTIESIDFPATHFLGMRNTIKMADMAAHYQTTMPKVGMAFENSKTAMAGAPSGLYYTWDMEKQESDLALAIPAAAGTSIDGLTAIDVPASKALRINYYGAYDGSEAAHTAMDAYIAQHKLQLSYPVMEFYVTDPGAEPDTSKWLTQIIYLVKE